jgi:glycosyltransferase involved in cell wall biosynthesis
MHAGDIDVADQFLGRADVLVICRAMYSSKIMHLIGRARARGLKVLYDVDDLVFDIKRVHLVVDTLDQDTSGDETWNAWFGWIGRYQAVMQLCDGAIVTNPYLAARAKETFPDLPVIIIPNFLNRMQQEISYNLFLRKRREKWRSNGSIHIGYFSGTPTHRRDFAIASEAIGRLMDEDRNVILRIVGFLDDTTNLARHASRIETFPLQDYQNLQRLIAEVDINIAPLQQNQFTNCKSELKFFEAAIVGTMTVATPTVPFREAIDDGRTGFLASSYGWKRKLDEAIAIAHDQTDTGKMAEAAHAIAVARYGWDKQSSKIESAILPFSQDRERELLNEASAL